MMKSLKELMDSCLSRLTVKHRFQRLEDFINHDEESAEFITSLSDGFEFRMPDSNSSLYSVAQSRARHSSISFLMGLVFEEFGGLMQAVGELLYPEKPECKYDLWRLTALNHDRGYTSDHLRDSDLKYEEKFQYALLCDSYEENVLKPWGVDATPPHTLAYTYEEIKGYDSYARKLHTTIWKDDKERIDHGILGGYILFNEMIKKCKKDSGISKFDWLQMRCGSLTIAQHNIFKSPPKTDPGYRKDTDEMLENEGLFRLMSDSDLRVSSKTPLLLLLSIVDTIECVKRFSKSETDGRYLQTLTVLRSIQVEVSKERIVLGFSQLREEIKRKNDPSLMKLFDGHLDCLSNLSTWTTLFAERSGDNIEISLAEGILADVAS